MKRMKENNAEQLPWWAKNRVAHFLVVLIDLQVKVIKQGWDIETFVYMFSISWKLTRKEE